MPGKDNPNDEEKENLGTKQLRHERGGLGPRVWSFRLAVQVLGFKLRTILLGPAARIRGSSGKVRHLNLGGASLAISRLTEGFIGRVNIEFRTSPCSDFESVCTIFATDSKAGMQPSSRACTHRVLFVCKGRLYSYAYSHRDISKQS